MEMHCQHLLLQDLDGGFQLLGALVALPIHILAQPLYGGLQRCHPLTVRIHSPLRLILQIRHLLRQNLHLRKPAACHDFTSEIMEEIILTGANLGCPLKLGHAACDRHSC